MAFDPEGRFASDVGHAALAGLGGLIATLMRREARNWREALLGAAGAAFVGYLVAKLCHATGVSDELTSVLVGVSGWLGAQQTITVLADVLRERLTPGVKGLELPPVIAPPPDKNDPKT
ncbi:hypothetical protein T2_00047 [Ralstonia phage Elie]|uniref:Holin n=4 Tax=Bakolyvirus TaxID=2843355 RepID=A0A7G5BBS6_9CAUD|nr:holin [Ralstonia phage Adzire]YP_010052760.1 holin [Ralstonia phage Bakoly]YP_010077734.1 holin [Ralstonia phage Simangalove]QMV32992.1 hypothetical protein T2_00047 [Ralstonia phage Elie]QMV33559.1 hypothetical protein 30B_00052 [Ralstonia phage Jenny]QMV33646.1 hypothetical protein S3_00002 [Ralstonia phage Sarlave]QMV32364.1 hypothetical protein S1_00047 [Ralstonia phage Adzire]QMV32584.1 hypothetical protein 2B_00011 [Ralstonia phage Bakoly]